MKTIRIIACVLDTKQLIMYKENGEQLLIKQGDPRIQGILTEATPQLISQGYADITLDDTVNVYSSMEKNSTRGIKFFSIAKKFFGNFFTKDAIPSSEPAEDVKDIYKTTQEIMEHAVPVTAPDFDETIIAEQRTLVKDNNERPSDEAPNTIIATVDETIVPGMENIKTYIAQASRLGSTVGVENFIKRISAVINERQHSIADLLNFMQRGDLPIANDGSILVYKVLRRRDDVYVDCYSQSVKQGVGSYVYMHPSLIDQSRRLECSQGLHIARRGYLSNFNGDVCVLCKLNPEDVITVPFHEPDKLRACGYHIIFELTPEHFQLLKANKPITTTKDGKAIIAKAIAGDHVGIIQKVCIKEYKKVEIQNQTPTEKIAKIEMPKVVESLDGTLAEAMDEPVNPKEVNAAIKKIKQKTESRKERAAKLVEQIKKAAKSGGDTITPHKQLCNLKAEAKVSWDKLDVNIKEVEATLNYKVAEKSKNTIKEKSYKEQIKDIFSEKSSGKIDTDQAMRILTIKRKAKKNWETLGVHPQYVAIIIAMEK